MSTQHPHTAAYAKLATREGESPLHSEQQQQEMTSLNRPLASDAIDTRLLLHPPPYNPHTHAALASSSSSSSAAAIASPSANESTPLTFSHSAATPAASGDIETGDGSASSGTRGDGSTAAEGGDAPTVAGLIVLDKGAPGPGEATITLMRLGGTGLGNVQLNVPLSWSVHQLLIRVYEREIREQHARIRVVFMGRVLHNDEILGAVGVTHGCILHIHVMAHPAGGAADHAHAPVVLDEHGNRIQQGEVLMGGAEADADAAAIAAAEGLYPGQYSQAQLALMRQAQFEHAQAVGGVGHLVPQEGTPADFLCGFVIGFVLGVIAIIWLYSPSLSRKQRLGILMGLLANFVMTIINYMNPQQQQDPSDGGNTQIGDDPTRPGGGVANG